MMKFLVAFIATISLMSCGVLGGNVEPEHQLVLTENTNVAEVAKIVVNPRSKATIL